MPTSREQFSTDLADILLADVAIRVQLSQTDYRKAVSQYRTINEWIERDESPLKDRVQLFYPQGSMAIGSTIASKSRTDEFDIDVIAQLGLPTEVSPQELLDLLYEAIRGEQGSRYYQMAKRRTRCVTVDYSDDMHLDVTPVLRMPNTPERQSWICHHRPESPREPSCRLVANPYGFAEWFKTNTPQTRDFTAMFENRAAEYEQGRVKAKADSEPVPPQEPALHKSKAVIVLQLLKRWRNVQYDRHQRRERRPPSVMISKLVGDAANHMNRLSEELLLQAEHLLSTFRSAHSRDRLVRIVNPVCEQDVLTDRWPGSLQDQAVFINDLEDLVSKVGRLVEECAPDEMREILEDLFGEEPAGKAVEAFYEQTGKQIRKGQSRHDRKAGRLVVPAAASPTIRPTRSHTFYGTERRRR